MRLFSTDLDGTLLGNPESTARFFRFWKRLPLRDRPLLVYNSGRMVSDMRQLIADGVMEAPDYLIGGIGTEIFNVREGRALPSFNEFFGQGWNLEKIEEVIARQRGTERQPPDFLHPYKSSWYLHRATPEQIAAISEELHRAGLEVQVIYSSQRDLDVLPAHANKGNALQWLCNRLGIGLGEVIVAGDTGNDTSMFSLPGVRGIAVENAQPQLYQEVVDYRVYYATSVLADGVIEGLLHYGVGPEQDEMHSGGRLPSAPPHGFFGPEAAPLTDGERATLRTGYQKALEALRRNITPLGFSACSLDDNDLFGTAENYRSVWARDGAITLMSILDLEDATLHDTARRTLATLLDAVSEAGQIPSNVRIDDRQADYSGVGGICSIDSGLWVIMAVHHYVRMTGDLEFLNRYAPTLQRAMDWLTAHDSNDDGLLEIPEAGDWTDLFGRSYNVLYDEVLWYRANVCYGRLLELRGDDALASRYLSRSQFIRGEILANFWPSTGASATRTGKLSFADQQFSLGDTPFLISQVSPFSFSWRCDVFGNLLAFLTNILDVDRARMVFHFLWGVGVNEPWPVVNLYPPVHAGDAEWRSYYTVNLLNLPYHYHNGGVWPFIGGMWVRFIYRLGYSDLALRELYRLAEINRRGREEEWEFSEWAHGKTGRPMGKRFQAWSAASFLRACRELKALR